MPDGARHETAEQVLRTYPSELEANLLVSRLDAEGIPARVRPHSPFGLPPAVHGTLPGGSYDVLVREEDLADAQAVLREIAPRRQPEVDEAQVAPLLLWITAAALAILALSALLRGGTGL